MTIKDIGGEIGDRYKLLSDSIGKMEDNRINMEQVVEIEPYENGYLITLEDGNCYYWEK